MANPAPTSYVPLPPSPRTFPREAAQAAFLLGGIGTGNVSIGSRGELRDWEIFNWPGKGNRLPFSFFAVRAQARGSQPVIRVLESQLNGPHALSHGYFNGDLAGLPRFTESSLRATYPFVTVELSEPGLPIRATMEAFTPFVPGDASASGIPGAVVRYRVTNLSDEELDVSVIGSFANATGYQGEDVFGNLKLAGEVVNQRRTGSGLSGVFFASDLPETHETFGSMAVAAMGDDVTVRSDLPPELDRLLRVLRGIEGAGAITFADRDDIPIRQGSVVFVPAGVRHGVATGDDSRLVLMFTKGPGVPQRGQSSEAAPTS